jgi:hypothetical protein
MANRLGRSKQYTGHVDLAIMDDSGKKIGEIRIKPNKILWASKGEKGWHGVRLSRFIEFMVKRKKQTK